MSTIDPKKNSSKRRRERRKPDSGVKNLDDAIVFEVARRWLEAKGDDQKKTTTRVATWLVQEFGAELPWLDMRWSKDKRIGLTRYRVYKIVRRAIELGFVLLSPPGNYDLRSALRERYQLDKGPVADVRVVGVTKDINEMVARTAAETSFNLIQKLAAKHEADAAEAGLKEVQPVSVGLGAGLSSLAVFRHLAARINAMAVCPKLRFHAMTSTIGDPMVSPVTFFRLFNDNPSISYVPLTATAFVENSRYEELKDYDADLGNAFKLRDQIELIISSLAAGDDPHGLARQCADPKDPGRPGWFDEEFAGDVLYLPYREDGPIRLTKDTPGRRAVTLFDWPDFEAYRSRPDRYFVICAGPCRVCSLTKTPAILPLLNTMRFWTHLISDAVTATELLDPPPALARRKAK